MAENVSLICPFCVKEGRTEPVKISPEFVRIPALIERWVPKWARGKGFLSLEEAVAKDPSFAALITKVNGRDEARLLCAQHGYLLKEARIWTEKLSVVLERRAAAADRKATQAFDSIGAMLGGKQALAAGQPQGVEPEGEDAGAIARAEQEEIQRQLATSTKARKAAKPEGNPKGKKDKPKGRKLPTKGRRQSALQRQIDESFVGDKPTEG